MSDFNDAVLARAAHRFALDPDTLTRLDGYENHVFGTDDVVLRIGHSSHRRLEQVEAELDWLRHLVGRGARAAGPIPSRDGRFVEELPIGPDRAHVVAAFVRAPGVVLHDDAELKAQLWNDELFRAWGTEVGRIHRLDASYEAPGSKRPACDDIADVRDFHTHVADTALRSAADSVISTLRQQLPVGYGLVHGDPAQWNFVVDADGSITLFDFDSAMYCWYAMDIAVALYYSRASDADGTTEEFAERFLRSFVEGYQTERRLTVAELRLLPDLLRLQTVILCSISHQDLDEDDTEGVSAFLAKANRILIDGEAVIPINFDALAVELAA